MARNDGGPAFPHDGRDRGPGNTKGWPHDGMTLRDWFAGQALMAAVIQSADDDATVEQNASAAALWAYAYADAMIAVREAE